MTFYLNDPVLIFMTLWQPVSENLVILLQFDFSGVGESEDDVITLSMRKKIAFGFKLGKNKLLCIKQFL